MVFLLSNTESAPLEVQNIINSASKTTQPIHGAEREQKLELSVALPRKSQTALIEVITSTYRESTE